MKSPFNIIENKLINRKWTKLRIRRMKSPFNIIENKLINRKWTKLRLTKKTKIYF